VFGHSFDPILELFAGFWQDFLTMKLWHDDLHNRWVSMQHPLAYEAPVHSLSKLNTKEKSCSCMHYTQTGFIGLETS
jgi:hypothetical protein